MLKPKLKYPVLVLLFLISIGTAYRMFFLWQKEILWGHLPLYFFLSLWAFLVLAFQKKSSQQPKKWRWLGLSTLSGVLLSLGFPPIPLTFLMFVGFVPLLIIEKEIADGNKKNSAWDVFKNCYHGFVVWNILTTYWVANTAFFAGIIAIWLNAFFMSVPFVLFHLTRKALPKSGYLAFLAYWMSFEMLHLRWEISWTWLNLGNAFAEFPSWIQWYEFTGTFGGALWILVANVLIFKWLDSQDPAFSFTTLPKFNTAGFHKSWAWILLPWGLSVAIYYHQEDKGKEVEVAVVQPNFEPHYEKFKASRATILNRFLKLSKQVVTDSTDYLVFPETSFGLINWNQIKLDKDIYALRQFVKRYSKLNLITGIGDYHIFEKGEPHSEAVRELIRERGDTLYYEMLNSAIQISSHRTSIPHYIKSKLVPGAEIIPYRNFFFFIEPLVKDLDGSFEGHGTQAERSVFSSEAGQIAPVICYESIYGEYDTGYIKNGAEAIFILTNDGWWDKTAGHKQHLRFASLRAIETRRSIARSANTGISAFLNQRGDILQDTQYGVEAALKGKIKLNDELTFYVKYGDYIGRLAVLLTAFLWLQWIARFLARAKEE